MTRLVGSHTRGEMDSIICRLELPHSARTNACAVVLVLRLGCHSSTLSCGIILSVCPQHTVIIFCNRSCSLLDEQKHSSLGVMIPVRHCLSSTDQNWRSYWGLTLPKSRCSRQKLYICSYFRENRFFSKQLYFFLCPWKSFLAQILRDRIGK